MSILNYLYLLFIEPIQLLFEVVFFYAYKATGNTMASIVVISLVINLLVLPLYKHADRLEKEQAEKKIRMKPYVDHIKATFKGDERVMMLQSCYRQNDYGFSSVLKESVSLFLQIPFFLAAYNFLSGLTLLQGVAFGPIADLGSPDSLIKIGGLCINLLPILMTLINIVSGFIYSKEGSLKDRIKLVVIASVFLVLLYNSPAGLVFYWTLNNLFSLGKNIVAALMKNRKQSKSLLPEKKDKDILPVVFLSCAVLAMLTGIMIPADVIVQNPTEMTNLYSTAPHSPLTYIGSSILIACGLFVIWVPLFVVLSKEKAKRFAMCALPAAAVIGIVNYIAFNKNFGTMSNKLIYEHSLQYGAKEMILNLLVDLAVAGVVVLVAVKFKKFIKPMMAMALLAVAILSVMRIISIELFCKGYNYSYNNTAEEINIPLTTTGQNVVVLMMDKMNGSYIPYIFNERPDVAAQFDGFTYYPNTVSVGKYTNFGTPAIFGGYDYTPDQINSRPDTPLVDKQNEALLLMPKLFSENGWETTVCDPPYANYQWIPDTSIFDEYENINAYNFSGLFNDEVPLLAKAGEELEVRLNRNLFCYGFMKSLPYALQSGIYCKGSYCYMNFAYTMTFGYNLHMQSGILESHIQEHTVLEKLDDVVSISDDPKNCFLVLANSSTHEISLLKEPEYVPAVYVDNTEYDAAHMERFTVNGVTMDMNEDDPSSCSYGSYEISMEACISLGKWFDYLRENGLYDNTRIIIVADHGNGMEQFEELLVEDLGIDAQAFNPILMVKDFNSKGFVTSDEFMTTADTPTLAFNGIIDNPVNPFTGNPVYQNIKQNGVIVYSSENNNVFFNNGSVFTDPEGFWLMVHDNIYDDENWSLYSE
ncbi:MAG: YidC/Oxa1 family membrane protein insertase [Saccharofermentans sp.]|nr:YidC/Oxa1 family membrane protein insertase [Saccharofermentans sp.]